MTSPLDEISFKLGEVNAGLAILKSRFDTQDQRFDRQDQKLQELGTGVGEIKTRMKPISDDLAWMKPQVRSYQTIRKRVVWFGGVFVAVFGVIGGTLSDWLFKKYFG